MNAPEDQDDSALRFARGVWIARSDLQFTFSRASGPGGQAVNKVSTRAQLRLPLSAIHNLDEVAAARLRKAAGGRLTKDDELLIDAQTHRSQRDNKDECIQKVRDLVGTALIRPKVRKKKKPTRAMIERRLEKKRQQSQKKQSRREKRQL